MRYFFSICLVLVGMGSPLLAKTVVIEKKTVTPPATPTTSTKNASDAVTIAAPASKTAPAKPKQLLTKDQSIRTPVAPVVNPSALAMEHPIGQPILGNRLVAFPTPQRTSGTSGTSGTSMRSEDSFGTSRGATSQRLARVTAYWAGEGDYYTGRCISSTGVRLHGGHCAVDPSIIPYGSVVEISGVGRFLAVDTGSAVISRTAAREGGHNSAERNAIVVDVFFADRSEGERFAACSAKFVSITWWTPRTADTIARARSLFAEEDWTKIQGKQL